MNTSCLPRRSQSGNRFAAAFVLCLAMVAVGVFSPGRGGTAVSAQAPNPCALLTVDDVETIAANSTVADGVSSTLPVVGSVTCRYAWGVGTGRFKLDVTVNEASRMFPGVSADQMRQRLLDSVRAGTADAVLSDIGEAAVFTPQSPVYASATALVKGRILALHLDGLFAGEMKDQVTGLLKSAAERL